MKKKKYKGSKPTIDQLKGELDRTRYQKEYYRVLTNTIYTLIAAAALAVLVAVIWMPVLEIFGSSMNPTLSEGEYVVAFKTTELERGDLVAFYYGNKLLVKRVIALPGELVEMDANGVVSINGEALEEPYIKELALGECEVSFPFEVPQEQYFVLGDRRSTSLDSRNATMGCVSVDQIAGKVLIRIWPLNRIGRIGDQ